VNLHADLITLLPELIVAVGAMALLIGGVFAGDRATGVISWLEANRPNSGGIESYQVILNGVPLCSVTMAETVQPFKSARTTGRELAK